MFDFSGQVIVITHLLLFNQFRGAGIILLVFVLKDKARGIKGFDTTFNTSLA
jgi:hypothetical protein